MLTSDRMLTGIHLLIGISVHLVYERSTLTLKFIVPHERHVALTG